MSIVEFWDSTPDELNIFFKAKQNEMEHLAKLTSINNYKMANMIAVMVLSGFNGKEPPKIYEMCPEAFTDEEIEAINEREIESMLKKFAIEHNKSVGVKNDT